MKILVVNQSIDPTVGGGTAERVRSLAKYLAAAGHEVTIATLKDGTAAQQVPAGVRLLELPFLGRRFPLPRQSHALREAVRAADIVHLTNHWTMLNVIVADAARRVGTPYVLCPGGALKIQGRSQLVKALYQRLWGRSLLARAARIISITQKERQEIAAMGVSADRIEVIPNGVSPDDLLPAADLPTPAAPYVLFLGRLNWIKGPDLLLAAYAALPELPFDLVFAGPDGGLLDQLRAAAAQSSGAGKIRFTGAVSGTAKARLLRDARALVVPSRSEAMSIVALEAGLHGTPVVLTDVCGFDEVAEIGGGRVVPANHRGITDGLRFIAESVGRLPAMGANLQGLVFSTYLWPRIAARHADLFAEICAEPHRAIRPEP
jgi:glycosyltransferase involved in cell wall biosynthesis